MAFLNTKYQLAYYSPYIALFSHTWKDASYEMDEVSYRGEVEKLFQTIDAVAPQPVRYVLSDTRKFGFTIAPELQAWVAQSVRTKLVEIQTERFALVLSERLFPKISIKQATRSLPQTGGVDTRYFDSAKEARIWLQSGVVISPQKKEGEPER